MEKQNRPLAFYLGLGLLIVGLYRFNFHQQFFGEKIQLFECLFVIAAGLILMSASFYNLGKKALMTIKGWRWRQRLRLRCYWIWLLILIGIIFSSIIYRNLADGWQPIEWQLENLGWLIVLGLLAFFTYQREKVT